MFDDEAWKDPKFQEWLRRFYEQDEEWLDEQEALSLYQAEQREAKRRR